MYEVRIEGKARRLKKKLPRKLRERIDAEVERIRENPFIGEHKVGDLRAIHVHKFNFFDVQILIAYKVNESRKEVVIYMIGPHENFYRDLKKYLRRS